MICTGFLRCRSPQAFATFARASKRCTTVAAAESPIRILGISGSLRKASYNTGEHSDRLLGFHPEDDRLLEDEQVYRCLYVLLQPKALAD